jgi:hypothetical protein
MVTPPVRWAYAFIAPLALLVAFLGLGEVDQDVVPQTAAVVRADGGAGNERNADLARRLERTAAPTASTVARIVADRTAPSARRTLLATTAPRSAGQRWLRNGYPDFTRSMTTSVRPMSDLDRFDASGDYLVVGTSADVRAVAAALEDARFTVSTTWRPAPAVTVVRVGFDNTSGLVVLALLGSVTLCVIGTVGAPRRAVIRRLSGRRLTTHLGVELSGIRTALAVASVLLVAMMLGLAAYNGLAQVGQFLVAAGAAGAGMAVPLVLVHLAGATAAFRAQPARAIRGHRPGRAAVLTAQAARVPAVVLVVVAAFDVVGSIAAVREGGAARDLRAAGDAVQLWITGDPHGDVSSMAYGEALGSFASGALATGSAFLSALVEVPDGPRRSVPALVVSGAYLRDHPVTVDGGDELGAGDGVTIAVPESLAGRQKQIVHQIVDWNLQDAPAATRAAVRTAVLDEGQTVFTYPGSEYATAWVPDAVVVAVGSPSDAFSFDQLGAWLSTGDVVFTSENAARQELRGSPVATEISAVVAVGQEAAERSRRAAIEARIDLATWVGSVAVSVLVAVQGARAARRRSARVVFGRFAAGWSPLAIDRELLAVEAVVLVVALGTALQLWWEDRPDPDVFGASLDPVSAASTQALGLAVVTVVAVTACGIGVLHRTRASVVTAHGKDR